MRAHQLNRPRSVRLRLPRVDDTGHVLRPIGHIIPCSCGWESDKFRTFAEAMQAGREHAAEHAEQDTAA